MSKFKKAIMVVGLALMLAVPAVVLADRDEPEPIIIIVLDTAVAEEETRETTTERSEPGGGIIIEFLIFDCGSEGCSSS